MKIKYEITSFEESELKFVKEVYSIHCDSDVHIPNNFLHEYKILKNNAYINRQDAQDVINYIIKNITDIGSENSWFILGHNICKSIDWESDQDIIEINSMRLIDTNNKPIDSKDRVTCIVEEHHCKGDGE